MGYSAHMTCKFLRFDSWTVHHYALKRATPSGGVHDPIILRQMVKTAFVARRYQVPVPVLLGLP
jgi:hypothetical protein